MYGSRKKEVLRTIHKEKGRLGHEEEAILTALRNNLAKDDESFQPISDHEYAVLSDQERAAFNSDKRIRYILSKEIEYNVLNRTISEKLKNWLLRNKAWIWAGALGGSGVKAYVYYVEHKAAIDEIIHKAAGMFQSYTETEEAGSETSSFENLTPQQIFSEPDKYGSAIGAFVELSYEGTSDPGANQFTSAP